MIVFILSERILNQIRRDRRFFALSVVVPLLIIFLFKIFFDTLPQMPMKLRYVVPISAFVVHFLSFILSSIALVQERTRGTLERLFINGVSKWDLILGYALAYSFLSTIQSIIVIIELKLLFNIDYSFWKFFQLYLIIWLLAIVSVLLGTFISTFAKHEGHVIPFIPLIIVPSVFFTGLLIDYQDLPIWAQIIGKFYPFHYAVNILLELVSSNVDYIYIWKNVSMLIFYIIFCLFLASLTLKDKDFV
ncbi:MAG: ABC transporter permease [candidate division WOR-3 bacterium]